MDASKLQTLYSLAGSRTAVGAPPPPIPWRHAASRTHPSLRARFPIQPAAPVSILLRRRQGRRPGALRRILYDMVLRVTTLTPYCLLRHKEHIAAYGEGNERRLTGKNETADIHTFRWVSPTVARRSGSANEMEQNGKDYFRNGGAAVDGVGATEAVENDDERQVWFLFIHL